MFVVSIGAVTCLLDQPHHSVFIDPAVNGRSYTFVVPEPVFFTIVGIGDPDAKAVPSHPALDAMAILFSISG